MLKHALDYLKWGFNVLPIRPGGKGPSLETWEEYKTTKVTTLDVKKWWTHRPNYNIGAVTGAISGVVVVDVDSEEGLQRLKAMLPGFELSGTLHARTGSGGWHFYFRHPGTPVNNRVGIVLGVDVRADGGFIVLPPSIHANGQPYQWINTKEILDLPKDLHLLMITDSNSPAMNVNDFRMHLTEGQRNAELTRRIGKLLQFGFTSEETLSITTPWNDTYCKPPLQEKEIKKIINSVAKLEQKNEKRYIRKLFDGQKFISARLAEMLMGTHYFMHTLDRLWVYEGGVYKANGARFVAQKAQEVLKEETQDKRISETVHYVERACSVQDITMDANYINLLNGRYNWKAEELEPHDPTALEITQLPVVYDPTAQAPQFKRYLDTTLDKSLHPVIEEILGLCVIPYTKLEKAFMFAGSGANGKSVFLDVLQRLLGARNVANIELQELEESRFKRAELAGKLANVFSDLSDKTLKTSSTFKVLVTGDRITAERKFGQPFEFTNYARLLFSCNKIPCSYDKSYAYERRWLILPFEKQFTGKNADINLRGKLYGEMSGILNHAIKGLNRLMKDRKFSGSVKSDDAMTQYRTENNTVLAFLQECMVLDTNSHIEKQILYDEYRAWCQLQGFYPVTQMRIKQSMDSTYPGVGEGRVGATGPRTWKGIKLVKANTLHSVTIKGE